MELGGVHPAGDEKMPPFRYYHPLPEHAKCQVVTVEQPASEGVAAVGSEMQEGHEIAMRNWKTMPMEGQIVL